MWLLFVLLAGTPVAKTGTIYPELTRNAVEEVIVGNHLPCGMGNCEFADGYTVEYTGMMASSGQGEWQTGPEGELIITGRASEGASDDAGTSMVGSSFETFYYDCWAAAGVITCLDENDKREIYVDGKHGFSQRYAAMVKVIPAKGSAELHAKVLDQLSSRAAEDKLVVFKGKQAKNPRKASEVWWKGDGKEAASKVAKSLEPLIGPTELKEWTWGGPPYDVIVVVAPAKATRK